MFDAQRESRFFRGWASVVLRLRVLVVPLLLALTVACAWKVRADLQIETSPEYFARGSSDAYETLQAYRDEFGRDDQYLILVRGDVFSRDFLDRLRDLHTLLESAPITVEGLVEAPASTPTAPPSAAPAATPAAAPSDDAWGSADDAAGFGDPPAPADPAPAAAPSDDTWGSADDAAGFGDPPAPADPEPAAAPSDDAWGSADDAAGFGDPPAPADPAPDAAPSDDAWGSAPDTVVEDVTSLINFRQTVFEGGALRVRGLMDDDPTDLAAFKAQVLADDTIVGSVVGAEGEHAVLVLRTRVIGNEASRRVQVALQQLVSDHSGPDFDIVVTGLPALEYAVSSSLMRDMRVLIGVAFGLMAIVLFIHFRHLGAVIAPLVVVGMSIIVTLAAMAATGTPVTLLTNIVPAFLICVGLGDSVHVQSVYRDQQARGMASRDAIVSAVGSTGMPILFTTLTTMVGLLSFRSASTQGIQELGMVAAFGVFVALWLSVTIIPLASPLMGRPRAAPQGSAAKKRRRDAVDRFLDLLTGLSATPGARVRVFVGAVLLAIVAGVGISRVDVFHDPLTWLPNGHPTQTSIRELDQHVGGTSNVVVVIEAPTELGVKDVDLLHRMDQLRTHVQSFEHPRTGERIVGNSMSLLGIIKETNRALHEGDPAHYVLPDTQRGVSDALLLFESAGPDALRRVTTTDLKKTHLSFRLDWMDASSLLPLDAHLGKGIRDIIGDAATATITGTAYSLVSTVGALIGDLIKSFGLAVIVIAIMMTLLLRNVKLAAIALVPNLLPVAIILGFMGFSGIPIDMATLLIASIVIGIAVDTTIHYLHQFRVVFLADGKVEPAIRHALSHAGRALVSTSSILALGFGAYIASSMANVRRFGILVSAACLVALLTNLILVPTLLRTVYGGSRDPR